jgi:hypothetical protein
MDEWIDQHMKSRSDDELRAIVTVDAHNWRAEAIAVAWSELRARGIESVPAAAVVELNDRKLRALPTRWLTFYAFMTPIGAAFQLLEQLRAGGWPHSIASLLFELAPSVALGWGLRKRRLWGWWLNWIFLGGNFVQFAWRCAVTTKASWVVFGVWCLLWLPTNYRYFMRRRELFT